MLTPRITVGAVLGGVVLLASACDGGAHHRAGPSPAHTTVVDAASAATVRTATCDDWNAATAVERQRLVRGMRDFFGGQVDAGGTYGQVLPDRRAYVVFDGYCAHAFASHFNLYRIYGNAAAFTIPQK